MIDTLTTVLSVLFQLLAAFLAMQLIRRTHHRTAWILIAAALVLMIARRVYTLIAVSLSKDLLSFDLYEWFGLLVSILMVAGLLYIGRYLDDTFAAESRLHESEQRYHTLARNIPDAAILLFERDLGCTVAEGTALQRLDLAKERIEGRKIREAAFPEGWNEAFVRMNESALNGSSTVVERVYKDQTFSIQFVPISNSSGAVNDVMAMVLDITQRVSAEKERTAAFGLLQNTIDGVADPVMVIGLDHQIKLMNRAVRESYIDSSGNTPALCYVISHGRAAPCNDPAHPCPLDQVSATLVPATVLHEHVTARGEIRQVEIIASPLFDEQGGLRAIVEASRDMTERRRAEAELTKLRKAVEASGEAIFLTDPDGLITFVNPEFTHMYGYTADEVVGKVTPRILKSGEMQSEDYALFWQTILGKHVAKTELVNRKKDGCLITIESSVNPVLDEAGNLEGFLAIQRDVTARKRAEQELENSERRFRALIENGVGSVALMESDGRVLWESPSTSRILGYGDRELLGQNTLHLIHPDDLSWLEKRFTALIAMPGAQDRATFRMRHQDGSWRWVEAVVTNLLTDPSVEALVMNYHDITDRKEAEREKNNLLSAIEDSLDGIAIADKEDRFIYDNQAHARIHGFRAGELIGKTWRILVPKEAEEAIHASFQHEVRNKEIGYVITEATGLRKDGSQVPIEFRAKALWDEDGCYAGHVCNVVDITQRKQAEDAIRRRAEELETLTRVSAALRTAQTQDDICRIVLSQVISLFGCKAGALAVFDSDGGFAQVRLGLAAWENWTGRRYAIVDGITGQVFRSGQPYVADGLPAVPDASFPGEIHDIPCAACIPLVTNQTMLGVLWLGRDATFTDKDTRLLVAIADMLASALQRQVLHQDLQDKLSDLQEAQIHIIQSEKLAAVGQLVSGIAHELNNPLTSIVLYTQMLQRRFAEVSVKVDCDRIVAESLRASRIVRGLLDFARQRPPEYQSVNVNEILRNVVEFVSYELRLHYVQHEVDLSPDVPVILADAHQLQQVFLNLANNAWQALNATQKAGHLWIKTELGPSLRDSGSANHRDVVRITVRDDGPGIPIENLSRVFDPFFTTKPEGTGTGLGLSICHGIVSRHGGNIWAESIVGEGSKFVVELPVVSPDRPAASTRPEHSPSSGSKRAQYSRILIIDDEQSVLEILTRALRSRGYTVDSLIDAGQASDMIAEVEYSTILCDIRMPGTSGPDFYKEACRRYPELARRIVFITGDVVNSKTQTFIQDENVRCLTKPFQLEELYNAIEQIESEATEGRLETSSKLKG